MIEPAVAVLADHIRTQLDLATTVEILSAPPSKPAEYPACAIVIDDVELHDTNEDELQIDSNGRLVLGSVVDLQLVDEPFRPALIDASTALSSVGTQRCKGRIFIATRHPAQRSEMGDRLALLFMQDDVASLRLVLQLDRPKLFGRTLPWSWPVAVFLERVHWTSEFVYDERVWAWIDFGLDVSMLIPRSSPRISQFIMQYDIDFTQPVQNNQVVDLDGGADDEFLTFDADGNIIPYTPPEP